MLYFFYFVKLPMFHLNRQKIGYVLQTKNVNLYGKKILNNIYLYEQ